MNVAWRGYYCQFDKQHPMEFQNMRIQQSGQIVGGGADEVGQFEINGQVNGSPQHGQVNFIKQYIGQHKIVYKGVLTNGVINGKWGFDMNNPQDDFMIEMKPQ